MRFLISGAMEIQNACIPSKLRADNVGFESSLYILFPNLNKFLGLGCPAWKEARATIQKLLSSTEPALRDNASLRQKALVPIDKVEMLVPIAIGDYTDFFSSMHHAKNCGTIFRGPENPIPANWFHLPIAYHGRASSIVISGTDIVRPRGQGHPAGNSPPYFGPSRKLDFELEMAAVVGPGNELGKPIDVNEAADHIFGVVLMNDWSGTTVSPWIVTLDALEPFVCDAPKQNPPPLPYLAEKISKNYDISLEVWIKPAGEEHGHVVTKSNFKHLYWMLTQQLAHHTINGCNLRPGDLLGTGTISGPEPESYGCLLELTWNGQNQLSLGGTNRKFLEDGDEVIFTGCSKILDVDSTTCTLYYQRLQFEARDLLGTGTISGPEPESYGCLLELTWNGQNQLSLGGTNRKFLEDGDEVIFTGCSKGNDYNVGFGTCSGKILPSPL
ncbi:hypothetical protein TEA_014962 [Camellia sinensis var. sinensis]|uniref:Fumarylacetoacetase n=1 Tax=Camellia sinensis var. sinensis TaxID=542762 RepID=A0A4S4E6N6_CAMSN|nr:hypothetical protein TEA_014962 [Camellia sinensis var. sinensis]